MGFPLARFVPAPIKDFLRPHVFPRRFHAFGVGMPKTGTHSLAAVFDQYRSCHEPEIVHFMDIILARSRGEFSDAESRDRVGKLDRRMWLELNSSYVNYFLLELLLEVFPRAKIILTVRDCYSWMDSIFNQLLAREHGERQQEFHRWYANSLAPGSHQDGDRALEENGLWPLDLWLTGWGQHYARVVNLVPREQLLIIRTQDILRDLSRIADFVKIPANTLNSGRSHEFPAAEKFFLLSKLDPNYLHERVEARCGDVMRELFPEIRGLSDVRGYRPQDVSAGIPS